MPMVYELGLKLGLILLNFPCLDSLAKHFWKVTFSRATNITLHVAGVADY